MGSPRARRSHICRSAVASLYPLAVLVGGFEAIHALHVGVERIGRYLQVYYENTDTGPRWETTVDGRRARAAGGRHRPALLTSCSPARRSSTSSRRSRCSRGDPTEIGVIGVLHLAVVIRIVRARGAAARQRAVELETFRAIHSQIPNPKLQNPNPNS